MASTWDPAESIVEIDTYQRFALATAKFPRSLGVLYPCLGDLGEAGEYASIVLGIVDRTIDQEVAAGLSQAQATLNLRELRDSLFRAVEACAAIEALKKPVRKGTLALPALATPTESERARLKSELGDGTWYKAAGAEMLGITLSDVATANIRKLYERAKAGVIASSGETVEERLRNG